MATKLAIIGDLVKLFQDMKSISKLPFQRKILKDILNQNKQTNKQIYKNKNLEKESMDTENRL